MTVSDETFSALEAEVAALIDVLLEAFADPEALDDPAIVADGLARYGAQVARIGPLAETGGLTGLGRVCGLVRERVAAIARSGKPLEDRQRELLEEWPGLTIGYLGEPTDVAAGEALVDHLRNPAWPAALSEVDAAELLARLVAPWQAESGVATAALARESAAATVAAVAWAEVSEERPVSAAITDGQEPDDASIAPDEADRQGKPEPEKLSDFGLAGRAPVETVTAENEHVADRLALPEPSEAEIVLTETSAAISPEPEIEIESLEAAAADFESPELEVPVEVEPDFAEPVFSLPEATVFIGPEAESVEGAAESLEPQAVPVEAAPDAAEALGLTADRLLKLKLIDGIIPEPPGGAHRDLGRMAENVRVALRDHLQRLDALDTDELLEQRYQKLMAYGVFKASEPVTPAQSSWQSSVAALLGKDKDS